MGFFDKLFRGGWRRRHAVKNHVLGSRGYRQESLTLGSGQDELSADVYEFLEDSDGDVYSIESTKDGVQKRRFVKKEIWLELQSKQTRGRDQVEPELDGTGFSYEYLDDLEGFSDDLL